MLRKLLTLCIWLTLKGCIVAWTIHLDKTRFWIEKKSRGWVCLIWGRGLILRQNNVNRNPWVGCSQGEGLPCVWDRTEGTLKVAVTITILVFVGLWVCDVCTEYMWVQGLRRMLGVFCYFALHSFETEALPECELPVSPRLKVRPLGSQE